MSTPQDPNQPFHQDPNRPYDPSAYGDPYAGGQYPGAQYPGGQYPGAQPGYGYAPGQPYPVGQMGPMPGPNGEQPQDPDNVLGIVGLVLSVAACSPVGLIISWIALRKSKERGYRNTMALVGAIIGGVFTIIGLLALIVYVFFIAFLVAAVPPTPSLLF